jgi:purine-nucleoside phosphorylase
VLGISCVTNWAGGISGEPLSHAEVTQVAAQTSAKFTRLLTAILKRI